MWALDSIYESGDYPFYYVSLVEDRGSDYGDTLARTRLKGDYNLWGYPTCYIDGGYLVHSGGPRVDTAEAELREVIEESGSRAVTKLELDLTLEWVADNTVRTTVSIYHTPDPFTIRLLPNPVLPFELDVIAFPWRPLASEPQVVVSRLGFADTLTMTQLGDRDAETYSLDYSITESCPYTISVCGTDVEGNDGCSDEVFSAAPVRAGEGTLLASYMSLFELYVPPRCFVRDGLLLCKEESPTAGNTVGMNLPVGVTPVLLIKAESSCPELRSEATLTVDLAKVGVAPDQFRSTLLLYCDEGGTRELQASLDVIGGSLTAGIAELGTFLIGISSSADDVTDDGTTVPSSHRLDQNRPNPFNAHTTISFDLPDPGLTRLDVYNILGRKVVTLLDRHLPAGNHEVTWDGRGSNGDDCSSGVYFYRMRTSSFTETRRMLLLK
jgi:hypothetical protein